jgi:type IV pilus assembly protein PilC
VADLRRNRRRVYFFMQAWKRNERVQKVMDRLLLRIPIFGT